MKSFAWFTVGAALAGAAGVWAVSRTSANCRRRVRRALQTSFVRSGS